MKYTPKPWEVVSLSGIGGNYAIRMSLDDKRTCYGVQSIYKKEDANLIAAAPDMYEALRNLENDNNQIPDHAWQMVQDAIAKAEGK